MNPVRQTAVPPEQESCADRARGPQEPREIRFGSVEIVIHDGRVSRSSAARRCVWTVRG